MNRNSARSRNIETAQSSLASDHETDDAAVKPTRLIRLPEVIRRDGLGRSTIYRKMDEGRFPRSRSI